MATSWLHYSDYAARKMMSPTSHIMQRITLSGTHKEIEIYSDTIEGIYIDNNQKISYAFKCSDDVYEERLIGYEDTQKLIRTIQKFDNEFQKEGKQK